MSEFVALPARDEYTAAQYSGRDLIVADSWYPAGLRVPRHAHRGATIPAVLSGSLDESYARGSRACTSATIVVRPGGEPHADAIGSAGVRDLEIDLTPAAFAGSDSARWFDSLRHIRDDRAGNIAARLATELAIEDSVRALAVEGLAMELVAITARLAGARRLAPPAWLSRAHGLIHDRFRDALTIAELASASGVHPVHFARVFRKQYGIAPASLIRQLRVRWAADRIRTTSDPLAAIAADAGFYDQAHFAHVFRKVTGVAASTLRRVSA